MPFEFIDHSRRRRRERHVPVEAIELAVRWPDSEMTLNVGRWNERTRSRRRFGDRILNVVWVEDDAEGFVVLTVWWQGFERRQGR